MTIEMQISTLKTYLLAKFEVADWHGVSDAANDLRVLEAQLIAKRAESPPYFVESGIVIGREKINGEDYVTARHLKCPSCKGPFGGRNCEYCK